MIEPAPAYRGEGPHALWHVSEDPTIERFAVRHADAGIRLETDDELLGLWDRVVGSTLDFSGIRLRNARLPA